MDGPATGIQLDDLAITYREMDLVSERNKFVGLRLLPVINTRARVGRFKRRRLADILKPLPNLERAPGSPYPERNAAFIEDDFATSDRGLVEWVDRQEQRALSTYYSMTAAASERCLHSVLLAHEIAVAQAVFNTSTWSGAALTTAVSTQWDANGTFQADVLAAKEKVRQNSGLEANVAVISAKVFSALQTNTTIADRVKYNGNTEEAYRASLRGLAEMVGLQEILVAGAMKNTADDGQSASLADVWDGAYCMVAHVNNGQDVTMPQLGRTFVWEQSAGRAGTVDSWYDPARDSDAIRARSYFGLKILQPECGHLLSNIT